MSRSLTEWKVLKEKFSPASPYFLCSWSQILTSTPLLASSSPLNTNAFLPVLLLKCALLPPALALSACVSSFLPKRNPSLQNVELDRSVRCISSSTDYSYPFCLPENKSFAGEYLTLHCWTASCYGSSLVGPRTEPISHSQHSFPGWATQGEVWGCACDCLLLPSPTGGRRLQPPGMSVKC